MVDASRSGLVVRRPNRYRHAEITGIDIAISPGLSAKVGRATEAIDLLGRVERLAGGLIRGADRSAFDDADRIVDHKRNAADRLDIDHDTVDGRAARDRKPQVRRFQIMRRGKSRREGDRRARVIARRSVAGI